MTEVRLGDKRIPFIYQGDELIHPAPIKDGLMLWHDFSGRTNNDAERGVAEDLSGNGHDGTLQNFNYTAKSGYVGDGLKFDGVDDYIAIDNSDGAFSQNAMTIEWCGVLNVIPTETIRHIISNEYVHAWSISDHISGNLLFKVKGRSSVYVGKTKGVGQTFHVVMTFDKNTTRAYVDGVLQREEIYDSYEEQDSVYDVKISDSLDSDTKSTRIYNRPLTAEEIAHNYQLERERFNL